VVVVYQSPLHISHTSLVDMVVAKEFLALVAVVVTKVVAVVVPVLLVQMLPVLEHLELAVVEMVAMEYKFHQHIYQTLLHKQILDQTLVNS
tara:strand:+ start:192 stop:464 length:273 start_codon:yes stop_codon:yes gene_type:complete